MEKVVLEVIVEGEFMNPEEELEKTIALNEQALALLEKMGLGEDFEIVDYAFDVQGNFIGVDIWYSKGTEFNFFGLPLVENTRVALITTPDNKVVIGRNKV
jgi:hypothetical protein